MDAALAIDPDFLAAHSLRDRILAPPEPGGHAGPPLQDQTNVGADPCVGPLRPIVAVDQYAKFEARAKRRRVDRRIDSARAAIERRRLKEAAAALDEIIELDPNVPELAELIASFDELRRAVGVAHRGPWLAAAATFVVALFGASWLQQSRPLESRPLAASVPLVESAAPTPIVETAIVDVAVTVPTAPVGTSGTDAEETKRPEPRLPNLEPRTPPPEPRTRSSELPGIADPPPLAVANPEAPRMPDPAPLRIANPESRPPSSEPIDEVGLVTQALQRYRTAYDGLDAQSAQAVYPAVNQAALARAFDGLESQTLTFDACDVQLRGDAARATCRGTARYVPKIGSREPRTEPRTWNFTLRKAGSDWKIDSARADR